ncbi:LysR family transcriptional regulator [Thermodesulfobacteriota bacterium]
MELRQLKTFKTVAGLMSFHRAAKVLNYAQSTVSAQIRGLEEELGVRLFERLGKRIAMTQAGQMLYEYAQRMLDIEAETLSEVRLWREPRGRLSIRVPQTIGTHFLPSILSEFQARFPGVGLDFHRCAFHQLEHELKTGTTDLAFLLADFIHSGSLVAEPLRFERLVLVTNPGNPLLKTSPISLKDLRRQPLFLPKADCGYRMMFERTLTAEKVEPMTIIEFNSMEMLKNCLREAVGVTIAPEVAVRAEIGEGVLVKLPIIGESWETAILMIWHRDKWLSPSLRAFMDISRELLKS